MTYAQKLKDLRIKAGKTQAQLAEILQTSQQYYGKYELEERPIPVEHIITLCKYYNVSADWLLGLTEK